MQLYKLSRFNTLLFVMVLLILNLAILIPISSIKVAKEIDEYLLNHLEEHNINVKDYPNFQYNEHGFRYSIRFDESGTMYIGYQDKNSKVKGVNTVESQDPAVYSMLDLLDMTNKLSGLKWYTIHKDSYDESLWIVSGRGSTSYTINPSTGEVIKN